MPSCQFADGRRVTCVQVLSSWRPKVTRVHEGWFQLRLNGRLLAGIAAILACWGLVMLVARHESSSRPTAPVGTLAGLPRNDITLGSPTAPMTLTVFADLTNPHFRSFDHDVLPALVERYVGKGLMKVRLRVLAPQFAGPDARQAARLAMAASLQGRLWDFVEAYESRPAGSIDLDAARSLLGQVPGLNTRAALGAVHSSRIHAALVRARRMAPASPHGQPVFVLDGDRPVQLRSAPSAAEPFLAAIAGHWRQTFDRAT